MISVSPFSLSLTCIYCEKKNIGNGERGDERDLITQDEKGVETGEGESDSSSPSGSTQKASMEDGSENNVGVERTMETEDEGVAVTVPVVSAENPESETGVVAVEQVSQSGSSSDEESKPVENLPESEVGEPFGSVSVTDLVSNLTERVVAVAEEVKLVEEAAPDEIPEVTSDIEDAPVENLEVSMVAETDSSENSGVAQFTEETVAESTVVVGGNGIGSTSVESEEKTTQLSPEAVSEKPADNVESSKESENPVSTSTEVSPPLLMKWNFFVSIY